MTAMAPTVQDIMTTPVVTIAPTDSALKAACTILNRSVSAVPVVQDNTLLGIIAEHDLIQKIVCTGKQSNIVRAADIMSVAVITGTPDMTHRKQHHCLLKKTLSACPSAKMDSFLVS